MAGKTKIVFVYAPKYSIVNLRKIWEIILDNVTKTAVIQTRINPEIKAQAQKVLDKLNISMSEAISVYLTQITMHNGIPFEIKIPNELTVKTLKNSEDGLELNRVEDSDDLFDELNR